MNWASPKYNTSAYYPKWATSDYKNYGYADHLDYIFLGAYASVNNIYGSGEWTMEGFVRMDVNCYKETYLLQADQISVTVPDGLTEDNLQVKVIGIGVPTVVDAATIVHDSMAHLLDALEEAEQKEFLEEMISPHLHGMFVTPKDVDETIKYLSFTISEGLNMTFAEIY